MCFNALSIEKESEPDVSSDSFLGFCKNEGLTDTFEFQVGED